MDTTFTYGLKNIQTTLRDEPHPPPCGEGPCTWCWFEADGGFIDEAQINEVRTIFMVGTGWPLTNNDLPYIGTIVAL